MKRFVAGVVTASLVAVGVSTAVGQGTGGTLGPGAVGTKTFEVRVKQDQVSVNCGNLPDRRCFRRGPRIANVLAGNGRIFDGPNKVGTALFTNIVGRTVGRTGTQDVFVATIIFDNNVDSLSVVGPGQSTGPVLPYAIVGGTGVYAGARGSVVEGKSVDTRTESRIPLTFTFIP